MSAKPGEGKRVIFTGGSGKAGRHCIPYLLDQGYKVLNLDLIPYDHPDVFTLKTDLTDQGQVLNALTSLFSMGEYGLSERPSKPDAIIHFAAYARNMIVPDNDTFMSNVSQTYNIIEIGCKLGIKKIIIASSETTYGVCFTQGTDKEVDYKEWPLEEDYDVDPEDSYACSKLCGERIARTFARRYKKEGIDIYALRIGNVIEPHEYEKNFPSYLKEQSSRKRNAWSYIDARDLGQICDLCIQKDGLGFQVFNATNDTITLQEEDIGSTEEFLRKETPNTEIKRKLGKLEGPLSNRKIREVLGFKENHNWRKYVN